MDPTTPPWRLLDAPSDPAAPMDGRDAPSLPNGDPAAASLTAVSVLPWARLALTIAGILVLVTVALWLVVSNGSGTATVDGATPLGSSSSSASDGSAIGGGTTDMVVEVVGAVRRPGVYRLRSGARVGELLIAAGGYGPRVDTVAAERTLNLAAALHDGDQIRVPSRDDAAAPAASVGGPPSGGPGSGAPIDLNSATAAELDSLPGIGPVTADKIIAAREEARFASPDELRSRGVLGEKTFERIRALVVAR